MPEKQKPIEMMVKPARVDDYVMHPATGFSISISQRNAAVMEMFFDLPPLPGTEPQVVERKILAGFCIPIDVLSKLHDELTNVFDSLNKHENTDE